MRQVIRELSSGVAQLRADMDSLFEYDLEPSETQAACRVLKNLLAMKADLDELDMQAGRR